MCTDGGIKALSKGETIKYSIACHRPMNDPFCTPPITCSIWDRPSAFIGYSPMLTLPVLLGTLLCVDFMDVIIGDTGADLGSL